MQKVCHARLSIQHALTISSNPPRRLRVQGRILLALDFIEQLLFAVNSFVLILSHVCL